MSFWPDSVVRIRIKSGQDGRVLDSWDYRVPSMYTVKPSDLALQVAGRTEFGTSRLAAPHRVYAPGTVIELSQGGKVWRFTAGRHAGLTAVSRAAKRRVKR